MKLESLSCSLAERFAQRLEVVVVDRVQAAEDHRLRLLVAGQRLGRRVEGVGDGVADVDVGEVLDLGHEVADLAGAELGRTASWRGGTGRSR